MMNAGGVSQEQLILDLEEKDRRLAELEAQLDEAQDSLTRISLLASFPEQNPNMVFEINFDGEVTYLNPIARIRFPDLLELGFDHPLLDGLAASIPKLIGNGADYIAREVEAGEGVFEQKICYLEGTRLLRIFVHDITALKEAEEEVQKMAQQLRELATRVVNAQEEERQRISRELHDEAGQALTALKISLELIRKSLPPEETELSQNLEEAITLTHTTRHHIRRLAQGLHPPVLDTLGIHLALEDLCREFSRRTRLTIDYSGREIPPQSDAVQVSLYRFVQEALTNVALHAQATRVRVNLDYDRNEIIVSVADNGRGLETGDLREGERPNGGLGLLGMRERFRLLDGWLEVDSHKGTGLTLVAHLPGDNLE